MKLGFLLLIFFFCCDSLIEVYNVFVYMEFFGEDVFFVFVGRGCDYSVSVEGGS